MVREVFRVEHDTGGVVDALVHSKGDQSMRVVADSFEHPVQVPRAVGHIVMKQDHRFHMNHGMEIGHTNRAVGCCRFAAMVFQTR